MTFFVTVVIVGFAIYLFKRSFNKPRRDSVVAGIALDSLADESQYGRFCSFIGSREGALTEELGLPDDTSTNDYGTRFLLYERFKSLVVVGTDGIVSHVDAPCQDTFGNTFSGAWEFQGVRVGDTRSTVQATWGLPSNQGEWGLEYASKPWLTKKKKLCKTRLYFEDNGLSYMKSMIQS